VAMDTLTSFGGWVWKRQVSSLPLSWPAEVADDYSCATNR
jgi:hypothetical protein